MATLPIPPPSIEDIGYMLWGPCWEPCMAAALNVSVDKVQAWIEDPTTIPLELEYKLSGIAASRTEEIELVQAMLFQRGLNRNRALEEGSE